MTVTSIKSQIVDTESLLLNVSNTTLTVTSEQFDRLCIDNPDLRLELTSNQELIVMPDFVIELRSTKDNLTQLQEKMDRYQQVGVKLGLLINPKDRQVEIYRPSQPPTILESPDSIDCNEVMPGFVLDLSRIW